MMPQEHASAALRRRRLDRLYYWLGIAVAMSAMAAMVPITWMLAGAI